MKKLIALTLIVAFLGMNCATYKKGEGINLGPDQKPGAKIVIKKIDGQEVEGELIAVKKDSLLVKRSESGADVNVGLTAIKTITILKEAKVIGGVGAGLLVGGLVGMIAGYIPSDKEASFGPSEAAYASAAGLVIGALLGALLGGIFSSNAGKDKTIQIEGKSDSEIQEILEKLRKKAREKNAQ